MLTRVNRIKDMHRGPMCHHHVDGREVGNGVISNGDGVGCTLVRGVIAILIAEVGKGPVAEFRLVGGCVDLLGFVSCEEKPWNGDIYVRVDLRHLVA
jgi:hypothetical protein